MDRRKIKIYPKVYPKARAFARREYVASYEIETLDKGYYNGYVDGVKAVRRALMKGGIRFDSLSYGKIFVDEFIEGIIGKPKVI